MGQGRRVIPRTGYGGMIVRELEEYLLVLLPCFMLYFHSLTVIWLPSDSKWGLFVDSWA